MILGLFIGFMLGFIACAILREQHEIVEDAITRTMDTTEKLIPLSSYHRVYRQELKKCNRELLREYPETPDDEWVDRLRKVWNEGEAAPLCHWCGQELQIVRPGHTQCVNPECKHCNHDAVLYDVEGRR